MPAFLQFRQTLLAITVLIASVAVAEAAETKKYSVVARGEKVGFLEATINGGAVDIVYDVKNNGRGPTIAERIDFDRQNRLVNWTVRGTSTFGGEIDEEYEWSNGRAVWRSQADAGDVAAEAPGVYIVNDGSPWANAVYVEALLKSKDRVIPVLPGGSLRLDDLGASTLGAGRGAVAVRLYAISGVDMQPTFVMIDRKGRLAATLGGGSVMVLEGYEDQYETLTAAFKALTQKRVEDIHRQVAKRFDGPIRYINVRIFDPKAGKTGAPVSVVVFDGKIASIDPGNPQIARPGETLIDGEGGVLTPGLYDMHSHLSLWSGLFYIAAGVTGTRDQGNTNEDLLAMMQMIEAGIIAGPRVVRNGFIEGRSDFSARASFIVDTLEKGLEAVRWYAAHDYFQIKIYNSMNPEWVKPLADEAKRLGLGVSGHIPAFMRPDDAILAGYDDIAHINQLILGWLIEDGEDTRTPLRLTALARGAHLDLNSPKVRRTIDLMKKHNVSLDTTTVILERLMGSRAGEIQPGDVAYLDHMPVGYQRYRKRTFVPLDRPEADAEYKQGIEKLIELMALLHANGVQLLPGTDDGTGFTVHRELELYAKAGIPNAEVLRLATLACAEYMRQDQLHGSIEKGKYADFFLVPDDPAENISAIRRIRLVSKGDTIYFPSEIYEAMAIRPFASPPPVRAP